MNVLLGHAFNSLVTDQLAVFNRSNTVTELHHFTGGKADQESPQSLVLQLFDERSTYFALR